MGSLPRYIVDAVIDDPSDDEGKTPLQEIKTVLKHVLQGQDFTIKKLVVKRIA
jgi:hypothetical protein